MNTKDFVNGIRLYNPNENAPSFVVAEGKIVKKDLLEYRENKGDEFKITVKRSQKGGLYIEVNNYTTKQNDK